MKIVIITSTPDFQFAKCLSGFYKFECIRWISGQPFCYTNWLPGEPNALDDGEKCGEMKGRAWNDLVPIL
jgi:hypothetical protein